MRTRARMLLAVAAAAAYASVPSASLAEPPALLSVGHVDERPSVTWSLPGGMTAFSIEVATSPELDGIEFRSENVIIADYVLDPAATSWTAGSPLPAGTYYVHVSGRNTQCETCPLHEWSAVETLVIEPPEPVAPAPCADGKDNDGDGAIDLDDPGCGGRRDGPSERDGSGNASGSRGAVVKVVDADTIDVVLTNGRSVRVRLLGIDAPERGQCFGGRAAARARELAFGRQVVLRQDPTQATRDAFGRLLAYVRLPSGQDLSHQLILGGFGKVYVFKTPFLRLSVYRKAEELARADRRGWWGACRRTPPAGPTATSPPPPSTPPPPASASSCHPSYSGYCVPRVPYDLDCTDIGHYTVTVVGSDEYRLDGDSDGFGCE